MSSWLFLKVFADTSLYFSLIGIVPYGYRFEFYLPALVYAAGAMLAHMLTKLHPSMRFACLILPLSTLLLASSAIEYTILILPIAYTTASVMRVKYVPDYYRFLSYFKKIIAIWCSFFGVCYLISELTNAFGNPIAMDFATTALYALASFLSSVLLLRSVRLGNRISHSTDRKHLLIAVSGVSAFALAAISIERTLMQHGRSIVQYIISFIQTVLASPIYLVLFIMDLLSGDGEREAVEFATEYVPVTEIPTEEVEYISADPAPVVTQSATEKGIPWLIIIAAFLVLAIVLFLMLRIQQNHSDSRKLKDIFRPASKKQKAQNATLSNRNKIRRYYRDFLKHEKLRGMKLRTDQTSLDILENVRASTHDPSAALRDVYLCARYAEHGDITSEQVEQARIALKKIREK